jgi:hypothetical protein
MRASIVAHTPGQSLIGNPATCLTPISERLIDREMRARAP